MNPCWNWIRMFNRGRKTETENSLCLQNIQHGFSGDANFTKWKVKLITQLLSLITFVNISLFLSCSDLLCIIQQLCLMNKEDFKENRLDKPPSNKSVYSLWFHYFFSNVLVLECGHVDMLNTVEFWVNFITYNACDKACSPTD